MSHQTSTKIMCIVVTYFPEVGKLSALINRLEPQVQQIVIIDNTPSNQAPFISLNQELSNASNKIKIVYLGDNYGIAKAINIGIEHAKELNSDFLLLSDQDSLPAENMVEGLIKAYVQLSKIHPKIAAIGSTFIDTHTSQSNSFHVLPPNKIFYTHQYSSPQQPHVDALTLISSGSLIPMQVFDDIGTMKEELFIDKVDLEWSLRARSKGYKLFGTDWAKMYHTLGDESLRFWCFGWQYSNLYSPLRMYYQSRNLVALWKLAYIPISYKLRNTFLFIGKTYAHVIFGKNRWQVLKKVAKGLCNGLTGKMGAY